MEKIKEPLERVYSNKKLMETLYLILLVYVFLDALILVWFTLTPLMAPYGSRIPFGLSMLGYNVGYLTSNCHQMPQRSLLLGSFQMPVCARDFGIYAGCVVAGLSALILRLPSQLKHPLSLVAFTVPLVVDGVTQTILSLRESSNTVRLITGLFFGFGLVYFFAKRIVENSSNVDRPREHKRAYRIIAFFAAVLLIASYYVGDDYATLSSAVETSKLQPTYVTYAGARTMQTLTLDPYIGSYEDMVLDALLRYGYRGHGVWIVYEGPVEANCRHVHLCKSNGTLRLVPDQ